jgi:hypothetical protein
MTAQVEILPMTMAEARGVENCSGWGTSHQGDVARKWWEQSERAACDWGFQPRSKPPRHIYH